MPITLLPKELEIAETVANRIGSKWSAVEIDDLTSHLYLWLVQNARAVERWRGEENGQGKLYVSLRREAAKYSAKEQAARMGRPITANRYYSVDRLDRALPFIFEDSPQTEVVVNPITGKPEYVPGEFNKGVTILAEIKGAFYGLNTEVRVVLEYRYRDGLTYEEIGELRNITKAGARKQVERAVARLSDALAGERY